MPITDAVEPVPILAADMVRFLTVLPVIVEMGVNEELSNAIPRTRDDVLVALLVIGPAVLPTVLLDTIPATEVEVCTLIGIKTTAPVDELVAVIEPIELLEKVEAPLAKLKYPIMSAVEVDDDVYRMLVEPSRLPIVLPVTVPILTALELLT